MARTVSIGAQGFANLRERGYFLVDKTAFIAQWWRAGDPVTLVCRPRRFGKTLNMSMVECFFSKAYAGRADLFEGLAVWGDDAIRAEQGQWPVVALSFAGIKETDYATACYRLCERLGLAFTAHAYLEESVKLTEDEKAYVHRMRTQMTVVEAPSAVMRLCELLSRHHGRHVIVLLDEYDTPMQEAWLAGYWDQMAALVRSLFNNTLKSNPYLERALITGITRVSRESIFSDLNNLKTVTATSDKYTTCFGFTQEEVDAALNEFGRTAACADVKDWYDGFVFGESRGIYNPWSITNYLDTGRLDAYWANSSRNGLVDELVRAGDSDLKGDFEALLSGASVVKAIDEQVVFPDLRRDSGAVWSLLVASGYLRIEPVKGAGEGVFELRVTNRETMRAFDAMVRRWFAVARAPYNGFVRALLAGDVDSMNDYMNAVALDTIGLFDAGNRPAESQPERFYHGFVLGLLVELRGTYRVTSNRESGFGRYDVLLEPVEKAGAADALGAAGGIDAVSGAGIFDGVGAFRGAARRDAIIIEFKVLNPARGEKTLEDTLAAAHAQIVEKRYVAELEARGFSKDRVRCYGFAFQGKRVLIG